MTPKENDKTSIPDVLDGAGEGSKTEKDKDERDRVDNIWYFTLFRFSSALDRALIGIAIIAALVIGAIVPYSITVVANAFQTMIDYDIDLKMKKANSEKFLHDMHMFGVTYSSIGFVIFIGAYLATFLMTMTAGNQIFRLRIAYLKAALNQDFAYFDTHVTGDFAAKMAEDVVKMEAGIGDKVTSFVTSITTAIGCVSMAIYQGWKLALLCLVGTPISFLLVGISGKVSQRLSKKGAVAAGKASALAEEVLSAIRTVYSFNGQQKEIERYRVHLASARRTHIWKECSVGLTVGLVSCSVFFSYGLSFYFGVHLITTDPDNYNAKVMFAVFFGVMIGMMNLGMTAPLVSSFGSARGAAAHIYYLLNNVPSINPQLDKGIRPPIEGNIELKNVVFHYPNRTEVTVLSDVSLSVKQGQSVALVGPSGSGKSTIVQLISRCYDVDSGHVYVDGHDVREVSVRWLRAHIGLVRQEPVLFNTTVRENIRYGRDDATNAEIEAVAQQANAHQFIMRLPKKYDTYVGEGGASLSGGQKQRIAIARALVRNPAILLLDEATSALDTTSEAIVQQALDTASKGRTTLTVAHRLSTIRHVDLIYVMKNGRIVEIGTHAQLMQKKGQYYDMVTIQEPLEAGMEDKEVQDDYDDIELPRVDSKISTKTADEAYAEMNFEESEAKKKSMSFLRVMKLNAPEWKSLTVGCICAIAMGFSQPLFILVFGNLFGEMSNPNLDELMAKAKNVALICVSIGLVFFFSSLCESVAFGIAGGYLTERLRVLMFEHMLRQPVGFFDETSNSTGALCARLSSEAAQVQAATGQRVGTLFQAMGAVLLALIAGFYYEWRVALVVMAFMPLVAIVVYYEMKATKLESVATINSLESSTKVAIEAVSNIRTVASLGQEPNIIKAYEEHLAPVLSLMRRSSLLRGLVEGLSRSLFHFMNSAALTYGGHLVVSDGVRYESLLITTQSLQMATNHAQHAFGYITEFHKGSLAATRIVSMLNIEPTMRDPEVPAVSPFISSGESSFNRVEFRYPTRRGLKVLRGLNLKVEKGKTFALVGESGCGKSTVIKLLQRYYDPENGTVALDNIPLPNLLTNEVRANLGLVSQEPVLFHRTIRENIAYGDNSRTPTFMEVEAAAKAANIHSFIVTLPDGYETNLGTKGLQLSGGQKQRVAIARALVRKPKILLLDEATSALDTESEKIVQEALDRAKAGRTCVMIAHRLSTVRDADSICVVKDGRLVEQGAHADLMARKGYYYELHKRM